MLANRYFMRRSTPKIEHKFSRVVTVALTILDVPVFKIKSTGRVYLLMRRRGLLHVTKPTPLLGSFWSYSLLQMRWQVRAPARHFCSPWSGLDFTGFCSTVLIPGSDTQRPGALTVTTGALANTTDSILNSFKHRGVCGRIFTTTCIIALVNVKWLLM